MIEILSVISKDFDKYIKNRSLLSSMTECEIYEGVFTKVFFLFFRKMRIEQNCTNYHAYLAKILKKILILNYQKGVSSFVGTGAFCYMLTSSIAYFVISAKSLSDFNTCLVLEDKAGVSVNTELVDVRAAGVVNTESEAEVAGLSSYT